MQILSFCHLRWGFVYQRPQHLMTRFGQHGHVHLWEEPIFEARQHAALRLDNSTLGVTVITPCCPHGARDIEAIQRQLLDEYIQDATLHDFVTWYYTPMALQFSNHLTPKVVVFDCMDELSAFQGAPPELIALERKLLQRADVVFAGGASLYASKRMQHANVHLFPSSIDFAHFAAARLPGDDPADQQDIAHPRIGFYGVLDERLDQDLLRNLAAENPEWQFILVGPVVKIREQDLPRSNNLHYLGQKSYDELPAYLGHWEVAMLPFAQNESTRFISPTKTPEYLAAGKPVVSTPIRDVVTPYESMGLVKIGDSAAEFGQAIAASLDGETPEWLAKVDVFLAGNSWDKTFEGMLEEIERCMSSKISQVPHGEATTKEEEHADV